MNILTVLIGANNSGGATGTFISALAAYCQYAKRKGYFVIVESLLSHTGQDTSKNNFNQAIRQLWKSFADAFCDTATNPLLGADGASTNVTYFQGGLHPTAAGQAQRALGLQVCINRYALGNKTYDTANTYTSSATQVDADALAILGASAGGQTFTLETAQGHTGGRVTLINTDTHSWTVAANTTPPGGAAAELINGAANVTVAAGKTLIIEGFCLSPNTAGAGWIVIQNG